MEILMNNYFSLVNKSRELQFALNIINIIRISCKNSFHFK